MGKVHKKTVKEEEIEKDNRQQCINNDYILPQRDLEIVNKFYTSYVMLVRSQQKTQNDSQPKYPFVIEQNCQNIIVHLGNQNVQMENQQQAIKIYQERLERFGAWTCGYHSILSIEPQQPQRIMDQKDSKNIVKNYCKAIMKYAFKNEELCLRILGDKEKTQKFIKMMKEERNNKMNIKLFSDLLKDSGEQKDFGKAFRIISRIFVQKEAITYIFNSKIQQDSWHIKYRNQVLKGIMNPNRFSKIKHL